MRIISRNDTQFVPYSVVTFKSGLLPAFLAECHLPQEGGKYRGSLIEGC